MRNKYTSWLDISPNSIPVPATSAVDSILVADMTPAHSILVVSIIATHSLLIGACYIQRGI